MRRASPGWEVPYVENQRFHHTPGCRPFGYAGADGSTVILVWAVALALLGVLAWAVMRSKAPAPSMTEAKVAAVGGGKRK